MRGEYSLAGQAGPGLQNLLLVPVDPEGRGGGKDGFARALVIVLSCQCVGAINFTFHLTRTSAGKLIKIL